MQFFEYPLNFGGNRSPREVQNFRPNSFSTVSTLTCNIAAAGGGSRPFTHIFLKCKNVMAVDLTPTIPMALPATVTDSSGRVHSTRMNDIDYYLVPVTANNVTQIEFAFSGTSIEVHTLMVLNRAVELGERFTEWELRYAEIARTAENIYGELREVPKLGGHRYRRTLDLTYRDRSSTVEEIEDIKNFLLKSDKYICAVEYNRFPDLVMAARTPDFSRRFINDWKGAGQTLTFAVEETL